MSGDDRGAEVPVCGVAGVGLVVSVGYPPEFLDLREVVFDEMAPLIHVSLVVSLYFAV